MADYKFLIDNDGVYEYATKRFIPNAPRNKHWRQYLDYVAAGGETDPAVHPLAENEEWMALKARVAAIEAEQATASIHNKTPQEVKDWIDAQFPEGATNTQIIDAIKMILKKMAVYLLKH